MSRLVFVRNGETARDANMIISAAAPGEPLNDRGRKQIEALGARLKTGNVVTIYSSPMLEARQSAGILAELAGGAEVIYDDRLRECSVGTLEGRSDADAVQRLESAQRHWYLARNLTYSPGRGAETGRAALDRVTSFVAELVRRHGSAPGSVVTVSHGALLRLALVYLSANLVPAQDYRRKLAHGASVVLEPRETSIACVEWSDN